MTALPAPFVQLLSSALLALLFVGPARIQPSAPPPPSPAVEVLSLTPGASLEREVRGGETQSFDVRLEARSFLFLDIKNRRLAVSTTIKSPGGETLAEGEGREGPASQLLALVAGRTDTYRLEVTGRGAPNLSGRYSFLVRALRPAAPEDENRVKGARALTEARRLAAPEGEDPGLRAITRFEEALAFWQTAGDPRGEVEALVGIAALYMERGDLRTALTWHRKAFERSKESGFSEGEAWALANMGSCNSHLGNDDQAIHLLDQSMEVWQRMGRDYERAWTLKELGLAYVRKQDFGAALGTFEQSRTYATASGDLALQISALIGAADVNYRQYRISKARELLEEALALSRQAGNLQAATIEQNLAVLYQNQGQLQKALDLLTRVAENKPAGESGMTHYNMGNLYLELGDVDRAFENYRTSQEVFHANGDADKEKEINALIGIGRVRQRQGDTRKALAEYLKAQQLLPQASWTVLHSIGLAKIEIGEAREAMASLEQALEIAQTSHDQSGEAVVLLALGAAHADLGQPARALEDLTDAVAEAREIGYPSVVALALLRRALLNRSQGHVEEALADVGDALAVIESTRRNIAGDQLRTGFVAARKTYYDLDIDLLLQLDRLQPEKGYRARALEASERARARGLLDLLAEGRIDLRQGLDPDLRQREDDLSDQITRVQRELRAGNMKPGRLEKLQTERDALDLRRQQLELEIQTKNKRYAEVRYPTPLKLDQIRRQILDDHTALLEYSLGEKNSTLFVVTREQIETYTLPASETITRRVQRLREALEQESLLRRTEYLEMASQLYRDLLAPAAAALAGKSDLLIVPDGALYYIPFEALLTEPADRPYRDLPYVLRRYSIAYIPSASVLAGLREPRQEPGPEERRQVVAFAPFASPGSDAVTRGENQGQSSDSSAARWTFKPLPASGREIAEITGLYPGASLSFVGGAADEAAVTGNPAVATARRLHFATHAKIDERHPEYSALVLAERPGEDGLLEMREILNLRLSADLAVLSACETGLGKEIAGEGLMGLTRAFFYAGVPSLVVSLWNVVDGPTPDLMLDFYQDLDRLQNKAKALQSSKLAMIAKGTYSHPSYWAPFILLGEPR